jgi:hypothetical protein
LNWNVGEKLDSSNPYITTNSVNKGIWSRLRPYTNRISIYATQNQAASDINIYIDDSTVSWKTGQVLKLVFNSELDLGIYNLKIYTNKLSSTGWKLAASFNSSSMISKKPYVELICIDEQNKTFELDILR